MLKRIIKSTARKKKRGQSTVEYLVLVAAIIAALLLFLKPGGTFQNKFTETLNSATDGMDEMANRLRESRP